MRSLCAADRFRRRFRQAEISHLAGLHELRHRADGVFDRRLRIHAMLVVEIDGLHAETLQRRVAGAPDVLWPPVDTEELAVLRSDVPELRRKHDLAASIADRTADQPFVGVRTVNVSGIEEVDAEVERAMNGLNRAGLVAP